MNHTHRITLRPRVRRAVLALAIATFLPLLFGSPAAQAQSNQAAPALKFKVGDAAPDFKLQYFDGSDLKDVSLSQYRGKSNVVLAFYIFAFTGG